jgi:hypothetical protein
VESIMMLEEPPRRKRRTKTEIALLETRADVTVQETAPTSTRHTYYVMTSGWPPVPKTDAGYDLVQGILVRLRRNGRVPYESIVDSSRDVWSVPTFDGPAEAVRQLARQYRLSYWQTSPVYLAVFCESRSIAGVVWPVCQKYAVDVYPTAGFASLSFAYRAAIEIERAAAGRPVIVLYIGDHDAAGVLIDKKAEGELRQHLPGVHLDFRRVAVTAEQIDLWGLPLKPSKDRRGGFEGGTVEAEAIDPNTMRELLSHAILEHIDPDRWAALREAEERDRKLLEKVAADLEAGR